MDSETKDIVRPLIESVCQIAEKQGLILQLLASNLPNLPSEAKTKLLSSALANQTNIEALRQQLGVLR